MYTIFLKLRMLFFRARLNIPLFLPILAWKYSFIILELYNNLKRKNLSFPFSSLFILFVLYTIDMYFMYRSSNCY